MRSNRGRQQKCQGYKKNTFDLAGFCTGIISKKNFEKNKCKNGGRCCYSLNRNSFQWLFFGKDVLKKNKLPVEIKDITKTNKNCHRRNIKFI